VTLVPGNAIALPAPWAPPRPLTLRRTSRGSQPPGSRTGADLVRELRATHDVACITVARTSPDDVGFREVFLLVDGVDVAVLSHGETITHELPAGPHRVRAHNTLFSKSHDVVLRPGEHARFMAVNRAGWGTFGLLMILGAAPLYLSFERERDA
jgi:hypothetical protein